MSPLLKHCIIGFLMRLFFIIYGELHDHYFEVPFTDIDYSVFLDAARYVTSNLSPYFRSTYRYTPLLAFMLTPSIFFHHVFGKLLFSSFDVCTTILIKNIILLTSDKVHDSKAVHFSLFWLYNPVSIIISTRGNSDSIIGFLTLLTLYFFLKQRYVLAGILHGLSIHMRLFPIVYSLVYFLAIPLEDAKKDKKNRSSRKSRFVTYLSLFKFSFTRCKLTFACVFSFLLLSLVFYRLYGYTFLYETYIYHLTRKDIRHNFSVYFYFLYLTSNVKDFHFIFKFLVFLPQLLLLLAFSLQLNHSKAVPFCLFCLTFTIVTYNPVLTSQYFVWFLPLLPICLPNIHMEMRKITILTCLWICAQLAWLLPAYWLEFKGHNTFFFIWIQSIAFFCSNIAILSNIVKSFQISDHEKSS